MSRDFYFYKVSRIENKVPSLIHPNSKYKDDETIFMIDLDRAENWMKTIGQEAIVEYIGYDYFQLSLDKFNSKYDSFSYAFNGKYSFYMNGKFLGSVLEEEVEKYKKVKQYNALLFKRELIHEPEDNYAIYDMKDGLYSKEELLKIAKEVEDNYCTDSYEALYTLYKCVYLASLGNLIWCEVG